MLKLKTGIRTESLKLPIKRALPLAVELGAQGIEVNARTELRPAEMSKTGNRHFKKMLQGPSAEHLLRFVPHTARLWRRR